MFRRWKYSMRTQLTILFVLVSIIPMLVIGIVSLRLFSKSLEDNGVRESATYLEFLDYRLNQILSDIHKDVLLAAHDESVVAYYDAAPAGEGGEGALYAARRLISLHTREKAHSVLLVGSDGSALRYSSRDYPNARVLEDAGYPPIDLTLFTIYDRWADPTVLDGEMIVPYERIVLSADGTRPVARLVVNFLEADFALLYEDYLGTHSSDFFLVNSRGAIASSSDKSTFGRDTNEALGIAPDRYSQLSGSFHANNFVYTFRSNARHGYTLMERTPMSYYNAMFRPILVLTLGLALASILLCLLLGSIMSRSFTKPLYSLIARMRGDRDRQALAPREEPRNEIAILNERYDSIIERLERVISQVYEEQRMKKEAQMRALEFQINPHFLYNTLSTIIWLIDAGEGERAIEITQELSSFFRISISKGKDTIPLRDEILHVKLYIDIQKARYRDQIFIQFSVPDELLAFLTPKLVLQPLVENSIIHAMQTNRDRTCRIRVSAERDGGDIVLAVEDDGEALTEERAQQMNDFLQNRGAQGGGKDFGIGISNVHDRVRMSFGEGYGLSYRRTEGRTRAELRIRAMAGDDVGKRAESHV